MGGLSQTLTVTIAASGTYLGNSGANKAIPHTLGRIPRQVIIENELGTKLFTINPGQAKINYHDNTEDGVSGAVTAMDATNFYVGDGVAATRSANNAVNFFWSAF